MKIIVMLSLMVSGFAFAELNHDDLARSEGVSQEARIRNLETQVRMLRKAMRMKEKQNNNPLQVQDLQGKQLRAISSNNSGPRLSPEKAAEVRQQLEIIKKRKAESDAYLKELMEED